MHLVATPGVSGITRVDAVEPLGAPSNVRVEALGAGRIGGNTGAASAGRLGWAEGDRPKSPDSSVTGDRVSSGAVGGAPC